LAQELDPEARAVDLVTGYAREGSDGDITVTDEMAQTSWDGWVWVVRNRYGRLRR